MENTDPQSAGSPHGPKRKPLNNKKRLISIGVGLIVFLVAGIWAADATVSHMAAYCHDDVADISEGRTALVLGTAKYAIGGGHNQYYTHRINAAAELYHSGRLGFIIVSGDNATKAYDEPSAMKADLVELGVPEDRIYCDYAGFRTLDSVERVKAVFSQNKIVVVSQSFHNERALYIARSKGIDAVGYNAQDVSRSYGLRTQMREKLARVKVLLDLHVLRTKPRFYGDPVDIG